MIKKILLGARFFVGQAPRFSRLGYEKKGLSSKPVKADFSGQVWLVTGASGGIGRQLVAEACRGGARVIAVARSRAKLDQLGELIEGGGSIETLALDLALCSEVCSLIETLAEADRAVDVLVNNVGVLLNEHRLTGEGFECSFATNLLNHYLLTERLLAGGLLSKSGAVINMSSGGMYSTPLLPRALDQRDPDLYDGVSAYAGHKRAQVALTRHWNETHRNGPSFYVMHPGWVDTAGVRTSLPGFRLLFRPILRNAREGADTAIWLAAERPAIAPEGIWLDRELQPEHLNEGTRRGPEATAELVAVLERKLAQAGVS